MPDGYFRNMPDDPYFNLLNEVEPRRPSNPPEGWYYHPKLNKYVSGWNPQAGPDPYAESAKVTGEFEKPGDFNLHRMMAGERPLMIGEQRLNEELRRRGLEYFGDLEGGNPSTYRDYGPARYHSNDILNNLMRDW